jgi:hypothetical protein
MQTGTKFIGTLECPLIEFGKLQKQRAEFVSEQTHRFNELIKFGFTTHEDLFVRHDLRDFHCEGKVWRGLQVPASYRRGSWSAVERAVGSGRFEIGWSSKRENRVTSFQPDRTSLPNPPP